MILFQNHLLQKNRCQSKDISVGSQQACTELIQGADLIRLIEIALRETHKFQLAIEVPVDVRICHESIQLEIQFAPHALALQIIDPKAIVSHVIMFPFVQDT